ncbi:L-2-hydroxyglutarate oxidase [Ochrobactrum daejeonense]|uniref:L-2-hydroxyglutarate oxidase n=1 Tax=Brucella daejeonensis TaxID=659015 RepID=A0A7W9ENU3_9HYPH|nr:L-2-hydroxyglutarate oxidase [Brucella daejeonensis]MBB5703081.1 L-2-hydroxyglutarate oxidase [Brucella daejeonensis]NKB79254.1 L-2-hydroxyglutarate oxidase [Brucella daejeonensis]
MAGFDYCVIGGGIVGLATAKAVQEADPGAKVIVLEKEAGLARHQTGHNSGVIHAGIYYQPGSLKAQLCRAGAEATKAFCAQYSIPFETCGKLLVATSAQEVERMEALAKRALQNDIAFQHLDRQTLATAEPAIAGVGALFVPATGIVDYARVSRAMAAEIEERGGVVRLNSPVTAIREDERGVTVMAGGGDTVRASKLVACAGLQSDRLARLAGLDISHRIVPFRGEYYTLPQSKADIVKHLIYPIPDPELPFLGIHLTRTIDGGVTVGPNAVLGFAREGYPKGSLRAGDVADMSLFPGFWKMALKNWRSAVSEFGNSVSRTRYLKECRKYCPELELSDLGNPGAGIRAQAVLADGTLVHDFLFKETERMLHVCNAPSPAATSSIPIGRMIADKLMGISSRSAAG